MPGYQIVSLINTGIWIWKKCIIWHGLLTAVMLGPLLLLVTKAGRQGVPPQGVFSYSQPITPPVTTCSSCVRKAEC